eukprot:926184_1
MVAISRTFLSIRIPAITDIFLLECGIRQCEAKVGAGPPKVKLTADCVDARNSWENTTSYNQLLILQNNARSLSLDKSADQFGNWMGACFGMGNGAAPCNMSTYQNNGVKESSSSDQAWNCLPSACRSTTNREYYSYVPGSQQSQYNQTKTLWCSGDPPPSNGGGGGGCGGGGDVALYSFQRLGLAFIIERNINSYV